MSTEREQRRSRILLAVAATSTTVALGLATLFVLRWVELGRLRAELLARNELQAQLLAATGSDHVVYPHASREIGFVLNPHLGRGTWRAARGDDYAIHSLGLRGDEIGARRPGTRRILLVGDSVVFGWKLPDADTIEAALEALLARKGIADRIEIVTVALPQWNIVSQHAFLLRHLPRLDPDFVVWSVLRNDFNDVGGVVPPGVLYDFASPQGESMVPIRGIGAAYQRELDMPFVRDRWVDLLGRIRDFEARHAVPTALLYWRETTRPYLQHILTLARYAPPVVTIPERYKRDPSWPISDADSHPTAWATERIALGLADLLAAAELLPALDLDPAEREVVEAFRAVAEPEPAAVRAYLEEQLQRLPRPPLSQLRGAALFGIDGDAMLRRGVLYVRVPRSARLLVLDLELPESGTPYPFEGDFAVLDRAGARAGRAVSLRPGPARIELELPEAPAADGTDGEEDAAMTDRAIELRWSFDHAFCEGPELCVSARVRGLSIPAAPPRPPAGDGRGAT
jgi:hypothetical protein